MSSDISFPSHLPQAVAGFFFCPETGRVLLHQRDGHTAINPHKWAFFTGLIEADESPTQGFIREIAEEIGYTLTVETINLFDAYINEERQTVRHVFFVTVEKEFLPTIVHEGAGVSWFTIADALQLDCTSLTEKDLKKFNTTRLSLS